MNNTFPDTLIDPAELADAANYEPDSTGQGWLIARLGLTRVSDNKTAQSYSVYQGRNANYFHNGTVIYNFAGTSLLTGMAAAVDYWTSFATYDIFVNGTNAQKTSNGSSFSALSNIPSGAKYIAAVNNFLYAGGHDKGKLRWANAGTAETWPDKNELILTQDENDDIVALGVTTNALLVLCSKSFQMITGFSNLEQEVSYYSKTDGCLASKSVAVSPYGVFWWSKSGIVWMKSDYQLDYPMVRKLMDTLSGLDRAQDANVFSVWDPIRSRVMFWLFSGTSQSTVNLRVDYYPLYDAFFLHTGAGVQMAAAGVATISGVTEVHVGGYDSSTYLFKESGVTDDGTAITAFMESVREGNPATHRNGRVTLLSTDLTSTGTINYRWYINGQTTIGSANSVGISPATGPVDTHIAINAQNSRIKHRIDSAVTTAPPRITQLTHLGEIQRNA